MPHTLPTTSPWMWRWFGRYAARMIRRDFAALRISRAGMPPDPTGRPMVIFVNHPGWWDPLVAIVLAQRYWPGRSHWFPIDADMLQRYRFFARLGFFGVEAGPRGAAAFLRTADAILARPDTCLWITAEGEFADPRRRPIRPRPGVAHLLRRHPAAACIPAAIEYAFWTERKPEALVRFAPPLANAADRSIEALTQTVADHLQQVMDALAADVIARNPAAFIPALHSATGTTWIYDAVRWARARLAGQPFQRRHMPLGPAGGHR